MQEARRFIFKNTVTEEVFVFPVTPSGYQIGHGRTINQIDMHGVGILNLQGPKTPLDETLTCFFPAHSYPFNQPEASTDPFVPLETLERWSDAGNPVRFIISGTPVNALVLLGHIIYGERDGTRDLYVTIPMKGYTLLTAPETELEGSGNSARAVETEPEHAATYMVQAGDTLWEIARWVYGDGSLYARLAAANGITNPNLIYSGQTITLPDVSALPAEGMPVRSAQVIAETGTVWTEEELQNDADAVQYEQSLTQRGRVRATGSWALKLRSDKAEALLQTNKLTAGSAR